MSFYTLEEGCSHASTTAYGQLRVQNLVRSVRMAEVRKDRSDAWRELPPDRGLSADFEQRGQAVEEVLECVVGCFQL